MIFEEIVRRAVEETSGGLAAIIMARDGISLSMFRKPEVTLDLETMGIEYANLLGDIARASDTVSAGAVREVSLATDQYVTLLRLVNPEYFIALVLEPNGNLGKGRFILRVSAPFILKEL